MVYRQRAFSVNCQSALYISLEKTTLIVVVINDYVSPFVQFVFVLSFICFMLAVNGRTTDPIRRTDFVSKLIVLYGTNSIAVTHCVLLDISHGMLVQNSFKCVETSQH